MLSIFLFISFADISWWADSDNIKNNMIPKSDSVLENAWWKADKGTKPLDTTFKYVRDTIFGILVVIAVWVFLYLWFKLITAKWNPEEFKKTMLAFMYAIIWLAIIPLAWWVVKLITWLQF